MIGRTVLHYRILKKLGEGGMGVVYKAEDTKLKRDVAIKFLPRHIAASDEERERFKIEAQAAAALNHPNIATIYAIEEVDDEMFIVMEYIEGQELREIVGHSMLCPDQLADDVSGSPRTSQKARRYVNKKIATPGCSFFELIFFSASYFLSVILVGV